MDVDFENTSERQSDLLLSDTLISHFPYFSINIMKHFLQTAETCHKFAGEGKRGEEGGEGWKGGISGS